MIWMRLLMEMLMVIGGRMPFLELGIQTLFHSWAAPGAKLHVVSDWFLRVFLFAVLSRCFLVNETVTSPTSASERTTSDGEGGHHAWPTYVEYSQIMSHSLAARLAIRQARGVNRVRFASSVPEYRYQNPVSFTSKMADSLGVCA